MRLRLVNNGRAVQSVELASRMGDGWCTATQVPAGGAVDVEYAGREGWYDVELSAPGMPAFGRRLAGRIAGGKSGVPDPRLEAVVLAEG
ncbi:phospholipase C, phosphocholine-specific [compost metagenome]